MSYYLIILSYNNKSQVLPAKAIQNLTNINTSWFGLSRSGYGPCGTLDMLASLCFIGFGRDTNAVELSTFLSSLFYPPPQKGCYKTSHRTIWQSWEAFPFAFKRDYMHHRTELSQDLTQQLNPVLSLGSAPASNVIGSDLHFLGDLQLSFTKVISSV